VTNGIPVLELRGSPREIGLAHGRGLRERIERCLGIYVLALGRSDSELRSIGASVGARIRVFSPELAEEIEGIAEGAGVEPYRIYVLNARSELMAGAAGGCTSVFVPERGLLGQNWDWLALLEPLIAVLRIERPDGIRFATLTEPGMVGKIGCSSAGLGVCLNFLFAPEPLDGVPVHVLLRDLLHQPDLAAARRRLDAAGGGRAANILLGSAHEGGVGVVWLGRERLTTELASRAFAHTNHVGDDPATGGPMYENSVVRLARARALAGGIGSAAELFALLSDRYDPLHPISVSYRPFPLVPNVLIGTVASVAMELRAGRMHLRRGPESDAPVAVVEVGPVAPRGGRATEDRRQKALSG
jgi:isopenicillin-N N-acyltransferase like protein